MKLVMTTKELSPCKGCKERGKTLSWGSSPKNPNTTPARDLDAQVE